MHKSTIYLENIVNNLPHFIFWKDKNSRFLGCNQLFAEAAELSSPAEIIGKSDYDMPWKAKAAEYIKTDQHIIDSGIPQTSYEEEQPQKDGSVATMLVSKVPMFDPQKNVVGILCIYMNITERKRMEQNLIIAKERAEAANEAKESFLRNMRHDLRTPFSGILTLSEWMATQETDPNKKENLNCIAQSARILLDYMNTVLEQARQSMMPEMIIKKPLDLKKLISDALEIIRPMVRTKGLLLTLKYSEGFPNMVHSDASCLQRILLNLLGNAVKFTQEGEINIEVSLVNQQAEKVTIAIAVSDTGIGIPSNQREAIFEKFTRLEAAYEGNYNGMGLGLYDVKELCQQLDGDVTVTANDSQGSIFICTFPFELSHGFTALFQDNVEKNLLPISDAKLYILLVEDQSIAAQAAKVVLSSQGYVVDVAINGMIALEKFTSQKYDLVLLDIGLPDIDGITLAKKFRKLETTNHQSLTPLIALTAHETIEENDFNVIDNVLNKPFSLTDLKKVLTTIKLQINEDFEHESSTFRSLRRTQHQV